MHMWYVAAGNTEFRNDLNLLFSQDLAVIFSKLFENADPMDAATGGASRQQLPLRQPPHPQATVWPRMIA